LAFPEAADRVEAARLCLVEPRRAENIAGVRMRKVDVVLTFGHQIADVESIDPGGFEQRPVFEQ